MHTMKIAVVGFVCLATSVARAEVIPVEAGGDIAAAVAKAQTGDVVQLAPGEHVVSATVKLDKGITVTGGFSGLTTVRPSSSSFRLFDISDADAVLCDVTLTGGKGDVSGGAKITAGTLRDAVVTGCESSAGGVTGGGVYINGTDAKLIRCVVKDNTGAGYGGGILVEGASKIESCLVTGNKASWGGGFYIQSNSKAVIAHCLVRDNSSTASGSGKDIYNYSSSGVKFLNCGIKTAIVANQGQQSGCVIGGELDRAALEGLGVAIEGQDWRENKDIDGAPFAATPSVGCTEWAVNRLRVVADGYIGAGAGKLTPGYGTTSGFADGASFPCSAPAAWTNAENTLSVSCGGYRVVANGATVDEGPGNSFTYEHPAGELGATLFWTWVSPKCAVTVESGAHGTVEVTGDGWLCEGDEVFATATPESEEWAFREWVGDVTAEQATQNPLKLSFVGKPLRVTAMFAARRMLTPDDDIVAEIAAAPKGSVLALAEGTYLLESTLAFPNAVTVTGAGADKTILDFQQKCRGVSLTAAGAVLGGVTIRNGKAATGGGAYISAGTLQDSSVQKCSATVAGNAGAGIWLEGSGAVRRCRISGNSTGGYGGGIYHNGGVIESCEIYSNSASWGGGLYGEQKSAGLVAHCALWSNTASGGENNGHDIYDWAATGVRYRNCIYTKKFIGSGSQQGCLVSSDRSAAAVAGKGVSLSDETKLTGLDIGGVAFDAEAPSVGATEYWSKALRISWTGVVGIVPAAGETVPEYGVVNGLAAGETFECSAPAAWTNADKTAVATCAGYVATTNGAVYVEGEGNAFTYEHPDCDWVVELVWKWAPVYATEVATDGRGTTEPTEGWFGPGDSVTAVPDEGYEFGWWEGAGIDSARRTENPYVFGKTDNPEGMTAYFRKVVYVSKDGDDANGGTGWDDALASVTNALTLDERPHIVVGEGVYGVAKAMVVEKPAVICGVGTRGAVFRLTALQPFVADHAVDTAHGVFYVDDPNAQLVNLAVTTRGSAYGRGICLADGMVDDCSITNCVTPNLKQDGGGIYMKKGTVRNCLIDGNRASSSGGGTASGAGVYMTGGTVENCTITRNSADYGSGGSSGGGVYMTSGTVRNCLIAKNQAVVNGLGVYASGGTVESCTIADNFYKLESAGRGVFAAAGVTFRNNIVWGNTNPSGLANASVSTTKCTNNDCDPVLAGTDNICVNPNFNDDYALGFSACVNGGLLLDWMEGATDLAGNPRVVGDRPDMGCFERPAGSGVECSFTAVSDGQPDEAVLTLTALVSGNTDGLVYYWKVWGVDGTVVKDVSGGDLGTLAFSAGADDYTVSLAVTNSLGNGAESVVAGAVKVFASTVYVNAAGSNVRPYATLESGAHDFETAHGLLASGGTVYVANGVYEIRNRILLGGGKGTKVISLNGPENCVVRPAASGSTFASLSMPMFELTASDARIEGMTLAGGRKGLYNAGDEVVTHGTVKMGASTIVTNCVICDITGAERGPSGAGVNMTGGTIVDTAIFNARENMSGGSPVSGVGLWMSGGLAERLTITNCWTTGTSSAESRGDAVYVSGGTIRNSLIAGCRGNHSVPVYIGGRMENCTVVRNSNTETYEYRDNAGTLPNNHCGGLGVAAGATVINTIVADNTSKFCGNVESNLYLTATANLTACLVPDRETLPGEGHVFKHPKYRRGSHKLRNSSPGVDQGVVRDWMDGAKDVEGQPRVQGVAPDIGCYEDFVHGMMLIVR